MMKLLNLFAGVCGMIIIVCLIMGGKNPSMAVEEMFWKLVVILPGILMAVIGIILFANLWAIPSPVPPSEEN